LKACHSFCMPRPDAGRRLDVGIAENWKDAKS